MIPQSAAYRQRVAEDDREWHAKAKITLANGTALNITDSDIMSGGIAIDAGVSTSGNFQIGTANIDELKLTLQNWDGKFSSYDFDQAIIEPSIGLVLPDGTTEWVPKGSYTVDDPSVTGNIITLTAFNRMVAFDKDFASCSCTFPATLQAMLSACCTDCGVSQKTLTFTNGAYVVTSKPENCTYRDVVACIAQLAGCFARVTYDGKLELTWYDYERFVIEDNLDGGTLTDYTSGTAADGGSLSDYASGDSKDGGIFRAGLQPVIKPIGVSVRTIGTDDLTVTGIKIVPQDDAIQPVVCGTSDYMIVIKNNPLVQSDPSGLAAALGEKLIGFTYRAAEITAMADPSVESGDVMLVTDKDGNEYQTIISRISYKIGTSEGYYADGETKTKKQTQVSTDGAKAVAAAKVYTNKIKDLSSQLNEMIMNSMGFYKTEEVQPDGSIIAYQHDQPTLAASHTIWKKTADTFSVSTDGGQTWNSGFSADGNAIVKTLQANRIESPANPDVFIDMLIGKASMTELVGAGTNDKILIGKNPTTFSPGIQYKRGDSTVFAVYPSDYYNEFFLFPIFASVRASKGELGLASSGENKKAHLILNGTFTTLYGSDTYRDKESGIEFDTEEYGLLKIYHQRSAKNSNGGMALCFDYSKNQFNFVINDTVVAYVDSTGFHNG